MSKRYKVGYRLGAIGLQIARTIDQGNVSNFDLVAIATRDEKKAAKILKRSTTYQISLPLRMFVRPLI